MVNVAKLQATSASTIDLGIFSFVLLVTIIFSDKHYQCTKLITMLYYNT